MTGTIGVLSGEMCHADFATALMGLEMPPGTNIIWTKSVDIVGNMNSMVEGMQGDWLWIMGSDHVFDHDLLDRLLAHDVDIVVPLCLRRSPPYDPVVFSHQADDGGYVCYRDLPQTLTRIHAAGSAGMLVKRRVFDAIAEPVFEVRGEVQNEDLTFCAKARDAGFDIWCDPAAPLGHISPMSVWPAGQAIELRVGNGERIQLQRSDRNGGGIHRTSERNDATALQGGAGTPA